VDPKSGSDGRERQAAEGQLPQYTPLKGVTLHALGGRFHRGWQSELA
jgi:hypothetical protein